MADGGVLLDIRIVHHVFYEASRHIHIAEGVGLAEERSYLGNIVTAIVCSHGGEHESVLWVEHHIFCEPLNSFPHVLKRVADCRDGVALSLDALRLAKPRSEVLQGIGSGAILVPPLHVAAKDEDPVLVERCNVVGSNPQVFYEIARIHGASHLVAFVLAQPACLSGW